MTLGNKYPLKVWCRRQRETTALYSLVVSDAQNMEKSTKATAPSARRLLNETGVRRIPGRGSKNTLAIGTWNVRSLLRPEKNYDVIREMQRMQIDILGLSDVRWKGNGKHRIDETYVMYYSGSDESSNLYGVGVIVNSKTVR